MFIDQLERLTPVIEAVAAAREETGLTYTTIIATLKGSIPWMELREDVRDRLSVNGEEGGGGERSQEG